MIRQTQPVNLLHVIRGFYKALPGMKIDSLVTFVTSSVTPQFLPRFSFFFFHSRISVDIFVKEFEISPSFSGISLAVYLIDASFHSG